MSLHLLSKSPQHPAFAQCLSALGRDDALLLLEDGVYALAGPARAQLLQLLQLGVQLCVLAPDAQARGLGDAAGQEFAGVDYAGFVALTERRQPVVSWF